MKLPLLIIVPIFIFLFGCGAASVGLMQADVQVEIANRSSRDLENAEAIFGAYTCRAGIVGKTFSAIYMSYPHPITPDTELRWDEGAKHRVEKIDLRKIYPPGKSGRLTFTVRDGGVEASFREKK
jgi:hypothetical protein